MAKQFLSYSKERAVRTDFEVLEGGKFALHYSQDVEPVLEINKTKQACGRGYYAEDNEMWKVASIPVTVIYEWIRRYGVNPTEPEHHDLLRRLLNSNEWRYLKTAEVII